MTTELLIGLIFLLPGLFIRFLIERHEAVLLRRACGFLSQPVEEETFDDTWTILLQRSRYFISATNLTRLITWLLIVPGLLLLMKGLGDHLPAFFTASDSLWAILGRSAVLAILLVLIFQVFSALFLKGAYSRRGDIEEEEAPDWMLEKDAAAPPLAVSGGLLWDWLVKRAEWVLKPLGLTRARAKLYEQDGRALLAIGEVELQELTGMLERREPTRLDQPHWRSEQDMIRAIQRLDRTLVREVMRPLNAITAVNLSSFNPVRFLRLAKRTGFTRFPCYYGQITNLIGYLNIYDFLQNPILPKRMKPYIHEAFLVPEVARVDVLLRDMLRKKTQIAICFDEFGGCSGMVTTEDILEEITGEIMDEYDRPEVKIAEIHGKFSVDALIDVDDLAEMVGLKLEKTNCDTLAGFIYSRLSRVPRRGDVLEEHGWKIEITHLKDHRVARVRLTPPPEWRENPNGDEDFEDEED